jgi:hypothetical protein
VTVQRDLTGTASSYISNEHFCVLVREEFFKSIFYENFRRFALALYITLVTIRTTGPIIKISDIYPHGVFMCFVWFSEQGKIVSLITISRLAFEMKA